jgi:plastocyanin
MRMTHSLLMRAVQTATLLLAFAVQAGEAKPQAGKKAAPAATPAAAPAPAAAAPAARKVEITVTEKGYEPSPIKVKKGEPLTLVVTRKTDNTCATELIIQDSQVNAPLPLNKPVEIAYTPTKSGTIKYGCAMGMMISGVLSVE